MTEKIQELAQTIEAMRPFVPAKDFAASKRFYQDLGFQTRELGEELAEMSIGDHSFLLQDHYVEDWAGNFMMHMLVSNVDRWWERIAALDLSSRYGVQPPKAPEMQPWGLKVAYVVDPSGVLWHFAERPRAAGA